MHCALNRSDNLSFFRDDALRSDISIVLHNQLLNRILHERIYAGYNVKNVSCIHNKLVGADEKIQNLIFFSVIVDILRSLLWSPIPLSEEFTSHISVGSSQ